MDIGTWAGVAQAVIALLVFFGLDAQRVKAILGKGSLPSANLTRDRVVIALIFGSLAWSSLTAYRLNMSRGVPEFDDPENIRVLVAWADDHNTQQCVGGANGERLFPYRSDYKLAFACLMYYGTTDPLDETHLLVSNLYDITKSPSIRMVVDYGSNTEWRERHSKGLNYILLLVPNGVSITQFTTLRQARSLKVKIIAVTGIGNVM